jgi:uncharacterized protein YcbX
MLLPLLRRLQGALDVTASTFAAVFLTALLLPIITAILRLHSRRRQLKHLRSIGLSRSNMADQFDPSYSSSASSNPRVKALYIHPVKSCAPIELPRALLTKTGFMYDRCFALAAEMPDPEDGTRMQWRFLSQRTKPCMALIRTEVWLPDAHARDDDELVRSGGCLVLSFADPDPDTRSWIDRLAFELYMRDTAAIPQVSCTVPLQPPDTPNQELTEFAIHGRQARGIDMSTIPSVATALPKLKRFLSIPSHRGLKLLRCTPDTLVRTGRNLAPLEHIGTPAVHGYTDQQPVHINSLSSVQAVSALLPAENQPLDALRFRANIWIEGAPAYDEDSWKRYRIIPKTGSAAARAEIAPCLSVVCRTSRCTMPNVDTHTGTFDTDVPAPGKKKGRPQPSTTLVDHRTVETGNRAALGYLGMHCVPEDRTLEEAARQGSGLDVAVGDEIEVLERGEHLFGSTANDY